MKRRTFLKGVGAFAVAPLAFVGAKKIESQPLPVSEIGPARSGGSPLDSAQFAKLLDKRLREVSEREYHKLPGYLPRLF